MPRAPKNSKAKAAGKPYPPRQTRSRTRVAGAAPLLSGLDSRGKPVEPLPEEPGVESQQASQLPEQPGNASESPEAPESISEAEAQEQTPQPEQAQIDDYTFETPFSISEKDLAESKVSVDRLRHILDNWEKTCEYYHDRVAFRKMEDEGDIINGWCEPCEYWWKAVAEHYESRVCKATSPVDRYRADAGPPREIERAPEEEGEEEERRYVASFAPDTEVPYIEQTAEAKAEFRAAFALDATDATPSVTSVVDMGVGYDSVEETLPAGNMTPEEALLAASHQMLAASPPAAAAATASNELAPGETSTLDGYKGREWEDRSLNASFLKKSVEYVPDHEEHEAYDPANPQPIDVRSSPCTYQPDHSEDEEEYDPTQGQTFATRGSSPFGHVANVADAQETRQVSIQRLPTEFALYSPESDMIDAPDIDGARPVSSQSDPRSWSESDVDSERMETSCWDTRYVAEHEVQMPMGAQYEDETDWATDELSQGVDHHNSLLDEFGCDEFGCVTEESDSDVEEVSAWVSEYHNSEVEAPEPVVKAEGMIQRDAVRAIWGSVEEESEPDEESEL